jgi:hypothetical protein
MERGLGTKVSAIIVSWKRPKEVGEIVEKLHEYDFIDEIIIAVNKPDDNKKCYRRWITALNAKNDTIYVQDDDCLVKNLDKLYESYTGKEMVIGLKGDRMIDNTDKSSMVGWGTFFDKSWIDFKSYLDEYGEDELLIRESDRILTYKIGAERPHNFQVSDIVDFPSAGGEMAMYLQPEHWDTKAEAIKRSKELYD